MAASPGNRGISVFIIAGSSGPSGSPTGPVPTAQIGRDFIATQIGLLSPQPVGPAATVFSAAVPINGFNKLKLYVQQTTPIGSTMSIGITVCDAAGNVLNTLAAPAAGGTGAPQSQLLYIGVAVGENFYHNLGLAQGAVGAVGPGPFPGVFLKVALTNAGAGASSVTKCELSLGA